MVIRENYQHIGRSTRIRFYQMAHAVRFSVQIRLIVGSSGRCKTYAFDYLEAKLAHRGDLAWVVSQQA